MSKEIQLRGYQKQIFEATKCKPEDAAEIEELMRDVIFHSTLDWQTKAQFNKGAREAKEVLDYMRSPEGIAYAKQVEDELLNPEKYR